MKEEPTTAEGAAGATAPCWPGKFQYCQPANVVLLFVDKLTEAVVFTEPSELNVTFMSFELKENPEFCTETVASGVTPPNM